jgi:fused signal recognition particle receptor
VAENFRSADSEHLETLAQRPGATLVRGVDGADSASVAFDGLRHARAGPADLLIADTAGRLPTKMHLMNALGRGNKFWKRAPKLMNFF